MRRRGRHRVPEHLFALRDQYVTVAGEITSIEIEQDPNAAKIDHVWITVRAGEFGSLQISLSTLSRQSRAAGLDPRVRVGVVSETWSELPAAGVQLSPPFDYVTVEAVQAVQFSPYDRIKLEELLLEKARRAIYVQGWGEFYVRAHVGIHQVHSRRASFAVPNDIIGKDGAIRFYFSEAKTSELLLFKFAGQP